MWRATFGSKPSEWLDPIAEIRPKNKNKNVVSKTVIWDHNWKSSSIIYGSFPHKCTGVEIHAFGIGHSVQHKSPPPHRSWISFPAVACLIFSMARRFNPKVHSEELIMRLRVDIPGWGSSIIFRRNLYALLLFFFNNTQWTRKTGRIACLVPFYHFSYLWHPLLKTYEQPFVTREKIK